MNDWPRGSLLSDPATRAPSQPTPTMKLLLSASLGALLLTCGPTAAALNLRTPQDQNSTAKKRGQPSELAASAGSWVPWRATLEEALAEAKREGKPVFWSIPTIRGSYMDRKVEIERYWLGGPMSWPRTIDMLESAYVPVHLPADRKLCEEYGIEPIEFIEPGYLVLNPDGSEALRADRLTTFHAEALLRPLERHVGVERSKALTPAPIGGVVPRELESLIDFDGLASGALTIAELDLKDMAADLQPEALFWIGVRCFQKGPKQHGRAAWERLKQAFPKHPLSAKASLELEGYGPFLRGLESFEELPPQALSGTAIGSAAPAGVYSPNALWRRSLRFLAQLQASNGAFLDSTYDFGGSDSLPNVVTAISSLAYQATLEGVQRGFGPGVDTKALAGYLESPRAFAMQDTDEIVWAYAYRLRAHLNALDIDPAKREELSPTIEAGIDALEKLQRQDGFWFHEYANAMVSATVLLALDQARTAGFEVDEVGAKRGAAAVALCRVEPGNYTYYPPRGKARAAIAGSPGRGPLCELALLRWGLASEDDLRVALVASFDNEDPWVRVRKYDNHARPHAIGGFFFWWGMRGRAEAIAALPQGRQRDVFAKSHWELTCSLAEIDGTFVDSHELGRAYGTSMALLTMASLEPLIPSAKEEVEEAGPKSGSQPSR